MHQNVFNLCPEPKLHSRTRNSMNGALLSFSFSQKQRGNFINLVFAESTVQQKTEIPVYITESYILFREIADNRRKFGALICTVSQYVVAWFGRNWARYLVDFWVTIPQPAFSELIFNQKNVLFNAEPLPSFLLENFLTPNKYFFVRNHEPSPTSILNSTQSTSPQLTQLNSSLRWPDCDRIMRNPATTEDTLMCAENCPNELKAIAPVRGVGWDVVAVNHATWMGVRLRGILLQVKADGDEPWLHMLLLQQPPHLAFLF